MVPWWRRFVWKLGRWSLPPAKAFAPAISMIRLISVGVGLFVVLGLAVVSLAPILPIGKLFGADDVILAIVLGALFLVSSVVMFWFTRMGLFGGVPTSADRAQRCLTRIDELLEQYD